MAVSIRMARHGRMKRPYYRIVVADSAMRRDGRYLELVGSMDPLADPSQNPAALTLKEDRIKYWIGVGAKPSDTVADLIEKRLPGYLKGLESAQRDRVRSKRAARKARSK